MHLKSSEQTPYKQITNVEQTETLLLLTQLQIYGHEQVQTSLQTYTLDIRLECKSLGKSLNYDLACDTKVSVKGCRSVLRRIYEDNYATH